MIYGGTICAKNGDTVPVFKSGKPAHSKYNPEAEEIPLAENFSGCVAVAGIAGGFHLKNLLKKNGVRLVVAFEAEKDDLEFCTSLKTVQEISGGKKIVFCTLSSLEEILCRNYFPAIHRNFTLTFQRAWKDESKIPSGEIECRIKNALKKISADFSVQSHFGKIWQRNILLNLKFLSENKIDSSLKNFPAEKIAAVVAAGPSLDENFAELKNRKYFVIATDTAFSALMKNSVFPDAVVSIDPQHVSSEHFFSCTKNSSAIFVFDICANPEAVKNAFSRKNKIKFVRSAHPLSAAAAEKIFIPRIESGSGTVTIAAADFARKAGFKKIKFFGADFSYRNGKPYAKGTYLDRKFFAESKKISPAENSFCALMFRTELKKKAGSGIFTTEILEGYEKSLLDWAEKYSFKNENGIFVTEKNVQEEICFSADFSYENFVSEFSAEIKKMQSENQDDFLNGKWSAAILPYLAFLKDAEFFDALKLAFNHTLRYNRHI